MLKEMLKIPTITLWEKENFKKFLDKLTQMEVLSPGQMSLIREKYESYKGQRKIVKSPGYFQPHKHDGNTWDKIGGHGLQKQLDLLGVKSFWAAANKVSQMPPDERAAWLEMANEVARLPHPEPEPS